VSVVLGREETSGPVSSIIAFDMPDDAIDIGIGNATPFGLSSGVYENRQDAITRFINELRVGTVNVLKCPAI
jgi:acyl-CoA reductase-like NAD-dependent aldehyde dehydrogenase